MNASTKRLTRSILTILLLTIFHNGHSGTHKIGATSITLNIRPYDGFAQNFAVYDPALRFDYIDQMQISLKLSLDGRPECPVRLSSPNLKFKLMQIGSLDMTLGTAQMNGTVDFYGTYKGGAVNRINVKIDQGTLVMDSFCTITRRDRLTIEGSKLSGNFWDYDNKRWVFKSYPIRTNVTPLSTVLFDEEVVPDAIEVPKSIVLRDRGTVAPILTYRPRGGLLGNIYVTVKADGAECAGLVPHGFYWNNLKLLSGDRDTELAVQALLVNPGKHTCNVLTEIRYL